MEIAEMGTAVVVNPISNTKFLQSIFSYRLGYPYLDRATPEHFLNSFGYQANIYKTIAYFLLDFSWKKPWYYPQLTLNLYIPKVLL